jgi:hypothetical protein
MYASQDWSLIKDGTEAREMLGTDSLTVSMVPINERNCKHLASAQEYDNIK